MKFKVREGFVVHTRKVLDIDLGNGDIRKEVQENTVYPGQTVDFDAAEAEDHLHKLEAADKEAQKYLDSRAVPEPAAPVAANGIDPAELARLVATAVTQALAAQPAVQTPPAP